MTNIANGVEFSPAYKKGYIELRDWETRIRKKTSIQKNVEARFGTIFDEKSDTMIHKPFHEIHLNGHCGEVSRITKEVSGGKINQKVIKGYKARLYFINSFGQKTEIASGNTEAIHSYVVDNNGVVWDPITKNWGTIDEENYLKKIAYK